ncbi:hypothetical protein C6A85_26545, partial [Mycobacterium sp. ITM-2017-0098]
GVLAAGQQVITGMLLATGTGNPEQGEAFARSALQFRNAEETVTSALPNDDWDSAAEPGRRGSDASTPADGDDAPSAPKTAESEAP